MGSSLRGAMVSMVMERPRWTRRTAHSSFSSSRIAPTSRTLAFSAISPHSFGTSLLDIPLIQGPWKVGMSSAACRTKPARSDVSGVHPAHRRFFAVAPSDSIKYCERLESALICQPPTSSLPVQVRDPVYLLLFQVVPTLACTYLDADIGRLKFGLSTNAIASP